MKLKKFPYLITTGTTLLVIAAILFIDQSNHIKDKNEMMFQVQNITTDLLGRRFEESNTEDIINYLEKIGFKEVKIQLDEKKSLEEEGFVSIEAVPPATKLEKLLKMKKEPIWVSYNF